ncbi:MAG: hypothetical protein ACLRTA_02285 [Clostridia bacterium]
MTINLMPVGRRKAVFDLPMAMGLVMSWIGKGLMKIRLLVSFRRKGECSKRRFAVSDKRKDAGIKNSAARQMQKR